MLDQQTGELEETLNALEAKLAEQKQIEKDLQEQRKQQSSDLSRLRQTTRDQEQQLNRQRNELARLEERVASLDRRRSQAIALKPNQVLGQLAGLVTIPPEYETAVAAGLGERLALWLVPEADDLWQAVDQSGRKNKSESGLLVAALADVTKSAAGYATQRPSVDKNPSIIGWANDLVTTRPEAKALVNYLLGSILLVDDPHTAYRLAL
ncbi:MAG: hypothetical protein R3C44_04300 [Chloroflexota bacterium]